MKKTMINKRTPTYLLLNLCITEHGYLKTFISTKFLRSKETEECVFLSLPEDMYIELETSEKTESGGWASTIQKRINPWTLRKICIGKMHPSEIKGWTNEQLKDLFGELPF